MPDQADHPPNYKHCTCARLCNGGRWIHERTYLRHKPHRAEDIAREREQVYTRVTGLAYAGTRAGGRHSHTPSSRPRRIVKVCIYSLFMPHYNLIHG